MNPTQLTVNVPDEMANDVNSWQDGKSYQVTVKQTGAGQFDLVSVDNTDTESNMDNKGEGAGDAEAANPASPNPAVAILMKKG